MNAIDGSVLVHWKLKLSPDFRVKPTVIRNLLVHL